MSYRLTVTDHISAAHALRDYPGKCERLHGHNFEVQLSVEGDEIDQKTGMLIDFAILKRVLKSALAELDHKCLNTSAPFDKLNPSSENLARYIWQNVQTILDQEAQTTVRIVMVSVSEKPGQTASYLGEV